MNERITSVQNPLIKHIVKLQNDRVYRNEKQQVVIEGRKMVAEAKNLQQVFTTDEKDSFGKNTTLVSPEVMKKMSFVKSPEGIVAIVTMPSYTTLESVSKILVLDGIQDPGNLGTLLRSALAFGWEGVYLLDNCCDPYNDKALRGAKGATFRLKLYRGDAQHLKALTEFHQVLIADLEGQTPESLSQVDKRVLVLGSESQGVSEKIRGMGERVTLPISKDMESLNVAVAGGILMYLL